MSITPFFGIRRSPREPAPANRAAVRVLRMLVITLFTLAVPAFAQSQDTLAGTVTNPDGDPVAGAEILLRGSREATRSDEEGRFRLDSVATGSQTVVVSAPGYNPLTRELQLVAGEDNSFEARLEPSLAATPTIVVTGVAADTDIQNAAGDIDVLAGREKRRSQTASLGASLERLAGVSNIGTGSQVGKPVIRGLSGNRIRVLDDGIGVNFQQFGVRHPVNIDPFLSERIEVVRGASSVLYGSDAIGGAVNVIPVPIPSTAPGRTLINGRVMGHYADVNDENTGALRLNFAHGGFGLSAALLSRDGGNLEVPDIGTFPETGIAGRPNFSGELDHTDFHQQNGELGVGYRGDFGQASLRYKKWDNEQNFLLPFPINLPDGIGTGQNLENESFQAEAIFDVSPVWSLKTRFTFVENLREANPGSPQPGRPNGSTRAFLPEDIVIDLERESYTGRAELRHAAIGPGFTGRFGVEVVQEEQVSRGPVALSPGGEIDNIAVFAFENIHFGRLHLELGARYDDREQSADPDETFDQVVIPANPDLREDSWGVFTGSIGANYHVNDQLSVVANIGRGFRAPELFELFANGVHGGVAAFQRGDPNLDEETSLNTDVGIRWRSERLELKANVYRNAISDYIFLSGTGTTNAGGLPIFQVDQDDARLIGADVTLDARLTDALSIRATGEVVDGEFDDSANGEDELPLMPADQVSLEGRYDIGRLGFVQGLNVTAGLRYVADKDSAGTREPFSQFDNTPFGTASTDDYTLIDLGVGFDVEYRSGQVIEFDIGVDNLTDETHRDFLDTYKGYALSPGRNIWLKASVPFGRD